MRSFPLSSPLTGTANCLITPATLWIVVPLLQIFGSICWAPSPGMVCPLSFLHQINENFWFFEGYFDFSFGSFLLSLPFSFSSRRGIAGVEQVLALNPSFLAGPAFFFHDHFIFLFFFLVPWGFVDAPTSASRAPNCKKAAFSYSPLFSSFAVSFSWLTPAKRIPPCPLRVRPPPFISLIPLDFRTAIGCPDDPPSAGSFHQRPRLILTFAGAQF